MTYHTENSGRGSDSPPTEITLDGVRGGDTGFPVQICEDEAGRLVIRAVNEGGFACVDIDFCDLLDWIRRNPEIAERAASTASGDNSRHSEGDF